MADMTRTVLVAHNGGLFGAERSLLTLAGGLNHDPAFRVLVTVPWEGPLSAACRAHGIPVIVSQHRQWMTRNRRLAGVARRSLRNLMALARTESTIRRFKPNVIYTGTGSTPFGALLARRWHVPHVWHLREFGERDYGTVYDWGERWSGHFLATHAHQLIANSKAVRRHFASRLRRPDIKVIYNGFDFGPAPRNDPHGAYRSRAGNGGQAELLLVGALVEGKGQHDAIRALAELARRGQRLRLTLAGSGDTAYASRLRRLVQHLQLTEQVDFAGFVEDPEPLYRRADLTLNCSRCEGFGRTAVESLAAGTPVIGTDAGGLPEILRGSGSDREPGVLYPPGNVQALANAIEALLADHDRYARMARSGPQRMRQQFGLARYVEQVGANMRKAALSGARPTTGKQRKSVSR